MASLSRDGVFEPFEFQIFEFYLRALIDLIIRVKYYIKKKNYCFVVSRTQKLEEKGENFFP